MTDQYVRTWRGEFPEFPEADMPELPAGFEDISWHNDCTPSFCDPSRRLIVQVDWADNNAREYPDGHRFYLCRCNADGEMDNAAPLLATDDWQEVLSFIGALTGVEQFAGDGDSENVVWLLHHTFNEGESLTVYSSEAAAEEARSALDREDGDDVSIDRMPVID